MKLRLGLAFGAALFLAAAPAQAESITVADILACGSVGTCVTAGGVVTASGGTGLLSSQTLNGFTGIGVGGGSVAGEIDGDEAIEIDFGAGVVLDYVELVFLYEPPAFSDAENGPDSDESALIEAFSGNTSLGTASFFVTGINTASVTAGSWALLSVADESGGAAWRWSNPFGASVITMLRFVSADPGPTAAYSDFAIGDTEFRAVDVPEPASLLLLGLGCTAVARRRRRS